VKLHSTHNLNVEGSLFSFIDGSTEELKKMLDLNILGLSVCTKEALQSMKERGVDDGHIIHINRLLTSTAYRYC
jgi:short-subunit dehydrogenase